MKILVFLISLSFSLSSFAQGVCFDKVDKQVEQETVAQGWSYHGIELISAEALKAMLLDIPSWSNELDENQIVQIQQFSQKSDSLEFYLMTGTGDYSGGYQNLLVVEKDSCGVAAEFTTYVE